jgi:hypothetical protein
MSTSKSNVFYDTLISLHNKLTCLNGVITLEAVDRLKDELGGIFTVAKNIPLQARSKVWTPHQRHP